MRQQPTVLDIARFTENQYRFCLSRPGEPFMGPTQQVWDVRVQPDTVTTLCKMIGKAVDRANTSPFTPGINLDPFAAAGGGLYDELLPNRADPRIDDLRRALRELQTPLLISTDDPDVLWEMLYDGEGDGFIGLKYDVGRRLKTRSVPSGVPRHDEGWRCLMIADPNEDEPDWALPDTAREVIILRDWLTAKSINCEDYLHGKGATFEAILGKLRTHRYDIFHYAGHIVFDQKTKEYALRLNGGQLFAASSIRNHVSGTPLVFLNSCWGGKAKGLMKPLESVEGLTDAFLEAGAQLVVGSLFEAPDEGARAFAEKFYESVLSGKTVGEAMRIARKHTMNKEQYAATWACFVMYGDPCLRIELKEDELQKLLQKVGLSRGDFEISCCRVVEQAFEYGRPMLVVSTPHLFAAMVGGENSLLRDRLREQKVAPEKLQNAFQGAFDVVKAITTSLPVEKHPKEVEFSENAKAILLYAREAARSAGREKITELDLVEAFVRKQSSGTREVLSRLGVNVEALAPEWTRPPELPKPPSEPPPVTRVGPLSSLDCTADAWQILLYAADLVRQSGITEVSTLHLFVAMLRSEQGPLAVALHRLSIEDPIRSSFSIQAEPTKTLLGTIGNDVKCSKNVEQILLLAQAAAIADKRDKVTADDLLIEFVQQGGGQTGVWLRQNGVVIEALISKVFLDDGELDMSRFNETARGVIRKALECARNKGHVMLGRRHLLYAMLVTDNSELSNRLGEQGKDAGQLADLLYVAMGASISAPSHLGSKSASMSPELLKIICSAEADMRDAQGAQIGEVQLLRALLADGGGEAGQFLVEHGVRWHTLMAGLRELD